MQTRHIIALTLVAAAIAGSSGNFLSVNGPIVGPVLSAVQGGQAKAATTQAASPKPNQAPAQTEGGQLRTMPHGRYQCALPGDAVSGAFRVVEAESFRIAQASSYKSAAGEGIYLMRGKILTFTRGPRKGEKFKRVGANQLQKLNADGSLSKLICTRLGSAG